MANNSPPNIPHLEGYELTDRLGAGGYGEVWRANAPGGLTKAVKCVFGGQDESRAQLELKALERVKQVRHPFLLSLERIEIVEGRLIVVSELADGSLRDRYETCIAAGLPGIPREELIRCLAEAADALDFLAEEHGLQHLDVKPENLLLLAGHVKVADFGLVKAVGAATQGSLVCGMTPTYAAPELFKGSPSHQCDQYSLAILYQEMLTGCLPFHGTNVAELTLQHMNDDPDMSSLPQDDRFVISQALSKDPQHRFESCRALIEALKAKADTTPSPTTSFASASPNSSHTTSSTHLDSQNRTIVFDDADEAATKPATSLSIDLPEISPAEIATLEASGFDLTSFSPTPCVFIGVGGAGAQILHSLRKQISEKFQLTAPLATMPMILLDTDPKSLQEATRNAGKGRGLLPDETIALPLKRPQQYKDKSADLLRWLGRRWLYNIPRSLKTEGIRPLGRLALIDHARPTFQRIRRTMMDAVSQESLDTAQEQTGLVFSPNKLRVYVVGSISGGSGSGMTLDIGYAIRSILERMDVEEHQVTAVLNHSIGRGTHRKELSRVNAFAWLSEFQHYNSANHAYPGDTGCGLPGHPAGVPAFDHTYLIDMGSGISESEFNTGCRSIGDYLFLDSVTPAQTYLDKLRSETSESDSSDGASITGIRSFSLQSSSSTPEEVLRTTAEAIAARLLYSWSDASCDGSGDEKPDLSSTDHLVHGAPQVAGQLNLDAAKLASLCKPLLEDKVAETLKAVGSNDRQRVLEQVLASFAQPSSPAPQTPLLTERGPIALLGQPLEEIIEPLATEIGKDLSNWIITRADQPGERLERAGKAAGWFRDHLESVRKNLALIAEQLAPQSPATTQKGAAIEDILRWKLDTAAIEAAAHLILGVEEAVAKAVKELTLANARLQTAFRKFATDPLQSIPEEWRKVYEPEMAALIAEADRTFHEANVADPGILPRQQEDEIPFALGINCLDNEESLISAICDSASHVLADAARSLAANLCFQGPPRKRSRSCYQRWSTNAIAVWWSVASVCCLHG